MIVTDALEVQRLQLANYTANATLSVSDIDHYAAISFNQGSPGIVIAIPPPTDATGYRLLFADNKGTASINVQGTNIAAGDFAVYLFADGLWRSLSSPPAAVFNLASNVSATSAQIGPATVTLPAMSFTSIAGRKYLVSWNGNLTANVINAFISVGIFVDGVEVSRKSVFAIQSNYQTSVASAFVLSGLAPGAHTFEFRLMTGSTSSGTTSNYTACVAEFY